MDDWKFGEEPEFVEKTKPVWWKPWTWQKAYGLTGMLALWPFILRIEWDAEPKFLFGLSVKLAWEPPREHLGNWGQCITCCATLLNLNVFIACTYDLRGFRRYWRLFK